jgi:hypothetical protein
MGVAETVALVAVVGLLIAAIIAGAEVFKRFMAYKERQLALTADKTAEKAAQYAAHVERLEERMRVLERIATDKGVDVAAQIESLRDERTETQNERSRTQ